MTKEILINILERTKVWKLEEIYTYDDYMSFDNTLFFTSSKYDFIFSIDDNYIKLNGNFGDILTIELPTDKYKIRKAIRHMEIITNEGMTNGYDTDYRSRKRNV